MIMIRNCILCINYLKKIENFFIFFFDFSLLGIVLVLELENEFRLVKLLLVEIKCVLFLFKNKYLVILFIDLVW